MTSHPSHPFGTSRDFGYILIFNLQGRGRSQGQGRSSGRRYSHHRGRRTSDQQPFNEEVADVDDNIQVNCFNLFLSFEKHIAMHEMKKVVGLLSQFRNGHEANYLL